MKNITIRISVFAIALLILMPARPKAVEQPTRPRVYVNGEGQLEIFWFYPGLHERELGNIQYTPNRILLPPSGNHRYAIFNRFEAIPPVYVSDISCYMYCGLPDEADENGFFPPLRMALKKRAPDNTWSDIAFDTIRFDTSHYIGQVVELPVDTTVMSPFELWTAFEYTETSPTSPYLGAYDADIYLDQYVCDMIDSSYHLSSIEGIYLGGIKTESWRGEVSDPYRNLQFSLVFSETGSVMPGGGDLLGSAAPSAMTAVISPPSNGYFAVRVDDGTESAISELTQFDHSAIAPIMVEPTHLNLVCAPSSTCSSTLELTNDHTKPVEIYPFCNSDSVQVNPSNLSLDPGATGTFEINLETGNETDVLSHHIIVLDAGEEFYPIRYNIDLQVSDPTDTPEDEPSNLPGTFRVSAPFPNPFNGEVSFYILRPHGLSVEVEIFNLLGRKINRYTMAGDVSEFRWGGSDCSGEDVSTGIYLFRFSEGNISLIRKALYLK